MLDFNTISGILVGVALVLIIRFLFSSYKDRASIYRDVKQGLLLFGYAFRDDKIKQIADTMYKIVSIVEEYDTSSLNKQYEAMVIAYDELLAEFDIILDDKVVELLVNIAVAHLPPTNKIEGR